MTLSASTLVFFDASSLFASAASPTGGSGFVLDVCQRGFLKAAASQSVMIEAERNLLAKRPAALPTFRLQLAATPITLISLPSPPLIQQYAQDFFEDAHVVASALAAKAEFLITLDQTLVRRIRAAKLPITAITPKEFLEDLLPTHEDYSKIR